MFAKTISGLDVYFPGCTKYYQQERLSYLPYMEGALSWQWRPRDSSMELQAYQRREFPSSLVEACVHGSLAHVITFWAQGEKLDGHAVVYEEIDATLLMWAAFFGHLPIARFLVDQGVEVNAENSLGHSALLWAVSGVNYDMARFLLDSGADPTLRDKQGHDAYFTAVQNNNLPLLLMMCEWRPVDAQQRDNEGHSLLHWAAYTNSLAICQYLVEKCHFDLEVRDFQGRTPLVWAAREGYAVIVEYLLACGSCLDVVDNDGYTASQYARYRNHREAAYVLEKYPAARQGGNTTLSQRDSLLPRSADNKYVNVRQKRRCGTIAMMLKEPIFFTMSIMGALHVILSFLFLRIVPPLFSYTFWGIFFFKNCLWVMIFGSPEQGGGRQEPSNMQLLGIANNFGDSARGPWLFRNRDASSLFVLLTFLLLQQYAWAKMGFTPVFWYYPEDKTVLTGPALMSVYQPFQNTWLGLFFNNRAELEQYVILFLIFVIMISVLMCKLFSMRAVYEPHASSTSSSALVLSSSPIWNIMSKRAYRWLHPRLLCMDRHMLLPLRVFYCYERDVFMRRYDSYSIALDCPIAESNHNWFVLFVTSFACLQWIIFFWSWKHTTDALQCPAYSSLTEWLVGTLWNLIFHALPCGHTASNAFDSFGPWLSWLNRFIPSEASHLGVWLLQYTFIAAAMATTVAVRQLAAVARGATRVEVANPTAPGVDGKLVKIFPPTPSAAAAWVPPVGVTEGFAPPIDDCDGSRLAKQSRGSRPRCIYENSKSALVNLVLFFVGRAGHKWRGAWAVSSSNTPVFTLSLFTDPSGGP